MHGTHRWLSGGMALICALCVLGCGKADHGEEVPAGLDDVGDLIDLTPDAGPLLWLDDRRILFSRSRYLTRGLIVVGLDGEVTLDAFPLADEDGWRISPDGTEIAYVVADARSTTGETLYVEPLNDDEPRRVLVRGDGIRLITWTVDGRWLIYNDPAESWTQAVPSQGGPPQSYLDENQARGSATVQIPPEGTLPPQMPDPPSMGEELYVRLDPNVDYGAWKPWEGGWKLLKENLTTTEWCSGFLPSPDGRLAACAHRIEDDLLYSDSGENVERFGAVIRVRP
jgi:dipeptidyl aminopeptidase/acylaminoacyl peptidase